MLKPFSYFSYISITAYPRARYLSEVAPLRVLVWKIQVEEPYWLPSLNCWTRNDDDLFPDQPWRRSTDSQQTFGSNCRLECSHLTSRRRCKTKSWQWSALCHVHIQPGTARRQWEQISLLTKLLMNYIRTTECLQWPSKFAAALGVLGATKILRAPDRLRIASIKRPPSIRMVFSSVCLGSGALDIVLMIPPMQLMIRTWISSSIRLSSSWSDVNLLQWM